MKIGFSSSDSDTVSPTRITVDFDPNGAPDGAEVVMLLSNVQSCGAFLSPSLAEKVAGALLRLARIARKHQDRAALKSLRLLLVLVDRKATAAQLKRWTPARRGAAEKWARAQMLSASDNRHVRVPREPFFVRALPRVARLYLAPTEDE